jgi:type II secretory pathway pseudopilin PulG
MNRYAGFPNKSHRKKCEGFTLMEALLSAILLALLATGISTLYISGLQSLNERSDALVVDSLLRSRMELLISQPLDSLLSGSAVVIRGSKNYTINWIVAGADLDGDGTGETNARTVTVSIGNRSLTMILVDHEGSVQKLL